MATTSEGIEVATDTKEKTWADIKAEQRSKPKGRVYDRARNRAMTRLAKAHPDEYQKFLSDERKREEKALRAAAKQQK